MPYQFSRFHTTQSVLRGHRNGVMIVVPAFTEGEDCDPETVRGSVGCKKAARAPHVRRGVNQPCGVQSENGAKEYGPQYEAPTTHRERHDGERCEGTQWYLLIHM